MSITIKLVLPAAVFLTLGSAARAQWVTESYPLKAGWNAIWLSHDASHQVIGNLVPGTIEEIWRWNRLASSTQFTESPALPVQSDTQWLVWKNGFPTQSTMTRLGGNAAYLVKVANGTADFSWQLTGKPVPPRYGWAGSGLNFFGFPMRPPDSVADRNFETFLSLSTVLAAGPDIFKYVGGPIANNPVQVVAPLFEPVSRGKAYWIRSTQYTDYYGPLQVGISNSGLTFGDVGTVLSLKVRNVTEVGLDMVLTPVPSVTPPAGQPALAGPVPLRLRGAFNPVNGQFSYTPFNGPATLALDPGEEIEVVFAVDRGVMGGNPGDSFQSILQITDSLKISRIDLPVSATAASLSGLWVGAAMVSTVDQITAAPAPLPDGTATVDVTTAADADTPSSFPIRLILHRADNGTVKLLQQVYLGENGSGTSIATPAESSLDPQKLASARRFSSSSFPLDAKVLKSGADLGLTGKASFSVVLSHTAATNPFVHAFHPDHDNKDAQFNPVPLPEGIESHTVSRAIDLSFAADPAALGLSDLGWGTTILGGDYQEVISGLRAQPITVKGKYVLYRVSSIGVLTE
ncbi:MAG: hypothetical protein K9N23_01200 [Akkermansiaceae bacterium]|nr:hypothetical protein [Akkermansiaceae bacterium]